ncbi:MAG: 3-aminobutyryl-CoA ammonia lyase [Deltaproteobacteria bacterium]|nr:3-aminobutyryl-CoA ammonia lyase [Deltaproteobacteria bacterium]
MNNHKTIHKIRLNQSDAHYGGNLVDGARLLQCFGDIATELCIQESGDEGLFRAYESVDFLAPVYAGDFLEIHAEIISRGKTSRKMKFEAYKVIEALQNSSKAKILSSPVLVCKAVGTCVVK